MIKYGKAYSIENEAQKTEAEERPTNLSEAEGAIDSAHTLPNSNSSNIEEDRLSFTSNILKQVEGTISITSKGTPLSLPYNNDSQS